MLTLRIERSDGTLVDELSAITAQFTRAFDEQSRAEVRLRRDVWRQAEDALDERNDRLFLAVDGTDAFGGRFDDSQANGGTVSVRLNSPEIDAADAEPTSDNLTYQNVDPELIATEAIGSVPTLSEGTIALPDTTVSYAVSFGSQSKILYDLQDQVGAEFRYNADFSVDVVDRLGADRSVTLGPAEENIGADFRKTIDEREEVTHVLGLGGESGPSQLTAEAVADSYTDGRKVWRRYKNKEVIDKTRLQNIIDQQVEEYDGEPRSLTVEATVFDEDLELGDRVAVEYPEENISRKLRIVSLQKSFTERGRELFVTLSNRLLTRQNRDSKRNDDLQRLNRGFGGFVDRDNFRAVERQPITADTNATGEYPYPDDVARVDTAEITVRSVPYRAYSSGAGNNTDSSNLTAVSSNGVETINTTSFTQLNNSVIQDEPIAGVHCGLILTNVGNSVDSVELALIDEDEGDVFLQTVTVDMGGDSSGFVMFSAEYDAGGNILKWEAKGENNGGDIEYEAYFQPFGKHTHPPDPGLIDAFPDDPAADANGELTASNVDVIINGTTVASDVGSGEFTTTIDISGELSPGVNDIELASDSLGLISAYVQTELFRRGTES